jgi:diguanylate cyclase (GGDEF)-like protein
MADSATNPAGDAPARGSRKRIVRLISWSLWVLLLAWQGSRTVQDPSLVNLLTLGGFVLFFVAVNAQLVLVRWVGERRMRYLLARLHGSSYLSDLDNLPNKNYLLSELRREMPRSRNAGKPFVLIVLSMDTFTDVVNRRGQEFGDRALKSLAQVLRRFTRTSDFIAHLGGPRFCVLLNECTFDDSFVYLKRVPGTIAVSDGHRMLEIPVTARVLEYDMQSVYATDVMREAEAAQPLRRKEQGRLGSEAA